MSLEESYYVSQILSTVAVVASLIYLALQTRQTAKISLRRCIKRGMSCSTNTPSV